MEKKLYVASFGISPTDRCNFNCDICLQGGSYNSTMVDKTIENSLKYIAVIEQLWITGGEPTLTPHIIKKIFDTIIKKRIKVYKFGMTTNGTYYSQEIEELFDEFKKYVQSCIAKLPMKPEGDISNIMLSADEWHQKEMEKIKLANFPLFKQYYNNIGRLLESRHLNFISNSITNIYDEGNAKTLDIEKKELEPLGIIIHQRNNLIYVNSISITSDGIVTDCDASYNRQHNELKYGNVNEDDLRRIILRKAISYSSLNDYIKAAEVEFQKKRM